MFSIQVDIDVLAAARSVSLSHTARHDVDVLLKTVLTEAFGGAVIRPWSLHHQVGPVASIIGYSAIAVPEIENRLSLSPTIRVTPSKDNSRSHGEQDAFLVAVDKGEANIEREVVYTRYLAERLRGAIIDGAKLTRFRLQKMTRPHRGASAPSSGVAQRVIPDAVLDGVLTVTDPSVFVQTLMQGVGRQRAYGRGYLRLEPTRMSVAA